MKTLKNFKKAGAILCALLLAGGTAAFSACNDGKDPDSSDNPPDDGKTEVTPLQFTGGYHDLRSFNMDFFIFGDMTSDGKGTVYLATYMGDSENISYGEIAVEWNTETDRDGLTIFNASTSDPNASFSKVSIYQESDGTFIWEYNFKFAGGYSRTTNLVGSDKIEYTVDGWKEYVKANASGEQTPDEPDTPDEKAEERVFTGFEVIQVSSGNALANMGVKITLYSDGTAKAERGYAAGGNIAYVYSGEEGSWTKDGTLTITFGDMTYTAEEKDGVYTFTYETRSDEEGEMTVVVTAGAQA